MVSKRKGWIHMTCFPLSRFPIEQRKPHIQKYALCYSARFMWPAVVTRSFFYKVQIIKQRGHLLQELCSHSMERRICCSYSTPWKNPTHISKTHEFDAWSYQKGNCNDRMFIDRNIWKCEGWKRNQFLVNLILLGLLVDRYEYFCQAKTSNIKIQAFAFSWRAAFKQNNVKHGCVQYIIDSLAAVLNSNYGEHCRCELKATNNSFKILVGT